MWAVELNRFGLELVGLWPKMNEVVKNSYSSDLRVAIIFVALVFSGIPLVYSLIRVRTDMILVIDNLQTTLPLMVVSLKLFMMRWKRTGLSGTIYRLTLSSFLSSNNFAHLIFHYIKISERNQNLYTIYFFLFLTVYTY